MKYRDKRPKPPCAAADCEEDGVRIVFVGKPQWACEKHAREWKNE